MSSSQELEKRLASNLRISQRRAVSALQVGVDNEIKSVRKIVLIDSTAQKTGYDYSKAVDYVNGPVP